MKKWWQKTVVYQIYPRSFKDSTGNGIGDLQGIIQKLDYLEDLGIETVWFSPFFKSPQKDHGYDIKDFRDISPEYGTMKDFEILLDEMHNRNMKMVLDFVLNHTSDQHPWFIESASSRDNPKRDWYIWRDGEKPNGRKPPNNWKAMVGGKAWRYYENTDQWVYFGFLPFQPDLNYRNPEVKEEMFNTMRFWLDKGVDGFRLDILHAIYEDEQLRNNPFSLSLFSEKKNTFLFQKHKYNLNLPETFDFALELRKVVDEYEPDRFIVGEVFGTFEELKKYYGPEHNGLNMCFLFEFTSTPFDLKMYKKIISRIEKALLYPSTPTYVYGNHDRDRYISRVKNDFQKAKLLATLQLTLRGVPFIYYGEEIGMPNASFKVKESQDPVTQKYSKFPIPIIAKIFGISLSRDSCRTPMQWNNEPNAGFSSNYEAKTWLKVTDSYEKINVMKEKKNPDSLFNCYKRLIKVRKQNISLQEGQFKFIELEENKKNCLTYQRQYKDQELTIYLNFTKKELIIDLPKEKPQLLFSTLTNRKMLELNDYGGKIKLTPFEGIIFS
ncbi:MAG: alpha-glucosidase [Candidatus Thorarchaeota archaeon]